jgi:putative hemolysin
MPLIIAFFLVIIGAFFSMSETAILTVSRLSVKHLAEGGIKRAKVAEKIIEKKERFISSVLIGNNLVTIIVSSMVAAYAINLSSEENEALALTIATFITTVVVVVFGDIIPKVMASRFTQKLALFSARPIAFVMFVLSPVVSVLDIFIKQLMRLFGDAGEGGQLLTEQEVLTMLDMGHKEGVIPEEESQMIDAVLEFRKAHASDIMTPRTDITAIPHTSSYAEVMEVFRDERFSRLPVYEEDLDHIIGVVNFKDFLFEAEDDEDFDVEQYTRQPFYTYETQSAQKLLANMRKEGAALAVVLDEYGGCAGLVTFEDLVERIMGDIFDEHDDVDDEFEIITEGEEYAVQGSARIEDFNKYFETKLESEDYDTIAGYVIGLFGYIPKQGEEISREGIAFVVEEAEKNRIENLIVKFKTKNIYN